jgi:hypothetical protein
MSYNIIKPPFVLDFFSMGKADLKNYFNWYLAVMPERITELEAAIRETPGFHLWRADYTPDSLDALGNWFVAEVETRPRTAEEVQEKYKLPFPDAVPNEELTNRTISLAMDIGMYLGKTLQNNYGHLEWTQFLNDKRFIDYGQPVLVGFGKVPMNPFQLVIVFARAIKNKRRSGERLRQLYDIWAKEAATSNGGRSGQRHIEKGRARRSR